MRVHSSPRFVWQLPASPVARDELTATDDPSKVMVRQMMAAFAQFEKARVVGKLAAARRRKREATGKCEGRKGHIEIRPEVVGWQSG